MFTKYAFGSLAAGLCLMASSAAVAQGTDQARSGSGVYPVEVTRLAPIISVKRGCTQLEYSAGIPQEDCGTMTLTEVVQFMYPGGADESLGTTSRVW